MAYRSRARSRQRSRDRDADLVEYGGDYAPRHLRRTYSGDFYDGDRCKPITSRVGAGHRARIAVETGGPHATAIEEARKSALERRKLELEEMRQRNRMEVRRRNDFSRTTKYQETMLPFSTRRYYSPRPPSPRRHSHESGNNDEDEGILDPVPPAEPEGGPEHSVPSSESSDRRYPFSRTHDDDEDYDFKLPLKPQAVTYDYVEEVSFPLDGDFNDASPKPSQAGRSKFSGPVTEASISQSHWLGSAYDRGDLSADISATSPGDGEKRQDPLMKWYHLERPTMSFEEFIAAAQSVLQVAEQKRRDVNKLLRDVQRKFEKQRQHGRDLEPNCVSDLFVGDSTSGQSGCVIFLSFPYFCLEPYNAAQLKNLTAGTPMHPLRPLLQAHFHSTSQKRELAQAVTKLPSTAEGNCLHLSQVWCLIVDSDTMVTCSRQSHDTLREPAITKSDVSATDESTTIKVSFGTDRSWQIPVSDDTTWPAFQSVFGESLANLEVDGATADFKINGSSVNASQWSFIVDAARTGSVGIDLQQLMLQPGGGAQRTDASLAFLNNTPNADEAAKTESTGQVQGETYSQEPRPTNVNPDDPAAIDSEESLGVLKHASDRPVKSIADDLDNVLQSNSREKEKKAYDRVDRVKPFAMIQWIRTNYSSSRENTPNLIRSALYLFRFFWPASFDHPLADKYWGAIQGILQKDTKSYAAANIDGVFADLMDNVIPAMESLTRDFSTSPKDLSPLPDAFSKAFLHLIMIFIILAQTSERRSFGVNGSTVRAHVKGFKDELSTGKRGITARLKAETQMPDLEALEICSHTSLLALVLNQFSQDVMHGKPDVASTYNDYFSQLDFSITEDPTPRAHQETLRFFLQEVEAILSTLTYQLSVLEAFEQSLRQQQTAADGSRGDNFLLRYALGESRQQIVIDDCKARIASRIDKFRGLQQRAEDLGEWHRNEMETNKDRQENAIMVFTIVTIIFLPLSFVSSVFGMNTSDVRDMSYSQWAYWAAAAPLTVLVVIGSLWWAGEFEGFGSWVQKALSRASSAGGYRRIPDPVSYGGRRDREEIDVRYAAPRITTYESLPAARRRTTYPRRRHG